jgi:uncharacterized protein DUF2019
MNQLGLKKMSADELIERLVQIGVAQDEAQLDDNHSRFNRLYDQMREVDRELRTRGHAARSLLVRLFDHPNIQVRLNAAALSLAVAPAEARRELEAIARSNQYPQAGEAGMLISGLETGTFKPT